MTEWFDLAPSPSVSEARYVVLLGYPAGYELTGRARELAGEAREWYAAHGSPWLYAREIDTFTACAGAIELEGALFGGGRMARVLERASGAAIAAVSAGPELEAESRRRWIDEKPDEYFFLETYGAAVVERLLEDAGARLCFWADAQRRSVLPFFSPGHAGWDVAEQPRLFELVAARLPGPLEALESGALRPQKSQLALFGLAPADARLPRATVPCHNCSLDPCQFRRRTDEQTT